MAMAGTLFGSLWLHINYKRQFTLAIVRGCITLTPDPWMIRGTAHLVFGKAHEGWHWLPGGSSAAQYWYLPLWCLLVPLILVTGWLFYRDRQRPPGHCRNCGYNLTANTTGTCPECGQATVQPIVKPRGRLELMRGLFRKRPYKLKWVLLGVSMMLAVVIGLSMFGSFVWYIPYERIANAGHISGGEFAVARTEENPRARVILTLNPNPWPWRWLPGFRQKSSGHNEFVLPLWCLLLPLGVCTALLFYRDRRRTPG